MFFIARHYLWLSLPLALLLCLIAILSGYFFNIEWGLTPRWNWLIGLTSGFVILFIVNASLHPMMLRIAPKWYIPRYREYATEMATATIASIIGACVLRVSEELLLRGSMLFIAMQMNADSRYPEIIAIFLVAFIAFFLYWRVKWGWGFFCFWAVLDAIAVCLCVIISGSVITAIILGLIHELSLSLLLKYQVKHNWMMGPSLDNPITQAD